MVYPFVYIYLLFFFLLSFLPFLHISVSVFSYSGIIRRRHIFLKIKNIQNSIVALKQSHLVFKCVYKFSVFKMRFSSRCDLIHKTNLQSRYTNQLHKMHKWRKIKYIKRTTFYLFKSKIICHTHNTHIELLVVGIFVFLTWALTKLLFESLNDSKS